MPDALSKTIPIWCCVLNRALFPDRPECHDLYVPPNAVSDSEKSQMLSRIPDGLDAFLRLKPDLPSLRAHLSRPVRPTWVTQETNLGHYLHRHHDGDGSTEATREDMFAEYRPVVCCTSSRRVVDGEMSGHTGYIQGAGDDTENWAHGLTPPVFWDNAEKLLSTPEAHLPGLIESLVEAAIRAPLAGATNGSSTSPSLDGTILLPTTVRQLTPYISVTPLPFPGSLPGDPEWCTIALVSTSTPHETWAQSPTHMEIGLGRHKVASRNLRVALANICGFVTRFLMDEPVADPDPDPDVAPGTEQKHERPTTRRRILLGCETGGRDLSVGVALALLCRCFEDDEGSMVRRGGENAVNAVSFNKTMIKIRLARIMTVMPDANPSRATLQSVNSFLMDWTR